MQWYIHFQGKKEGPFTPAEFRQRLANLAARDQVFVWRSGMEGWKKVQDVPEIAELEAQPPSGGSMTQAQKDLSVLFEMPKVADEKTQALDTKKLKSLKKEAKQAEKVASKARAQAKVTVEETPPGMEGESRGRPRLFKMLGLIVVIAAAAGGAAFYLRNAKPHLNPISDLAPGDFQKLESTATIPANQGVHVELALSTSDVVHPKFYLSSNQKDLHLAVTLDPIAGTFVQKAPPPQTLNVSEMKNYVATTDRIETPEGEYNVKVTDATRPQTVFASGKFFLGGVKNAAYTQALTQAREQKKTLADSELRDLNESSAQLEAFLEILQEVKRDPKTFTANQVKWDDLEKGFALHSILMRADATEDKVVLYSLLKQGRDVWKQFKAINDLQKSAAAPGSNAAQINSQIETAFTQALAAFTAFKASLLKTNTAEIQ